MNETYFQCPAITIDRYRYQYVWSWLIDSKWVSYYVALVILRLSKM